LPAAGPFPLPTCTFGDYAWKDYELSLEARKDGGAEGFLIIVRSQSDRDLYWFNLGGWSNSKHAVERSAKGTRSPVGSARPGSIEPRIWHQIRVRCEAEHLQAWIDGESAGDVNDLSPSAYMNGRVGVGTWNTAASFRNIKVVSLRGDLLFSGMPEE
jgi:alpha-L-arabinofuranosidase